MHLLLKKMYLLLKKFHSCNLLRCQSEIPPSPSAAHASPPLTSFPCTVLTEIFSIRGKVNGITYTYQKKFIRSPHAIFPKIRYTIEI